MKKLLLPLFLAAVSSTAFCQDYEELKAFQEASGQSSTLFRGVENTKYNIRFNGSYYWENDTFRKGDVFFDGKLYKDIYVNIDACSRTPVVSYDLTSGFIALDPLKVRYILIDGTSFDNLSLMGHTEVPEGFYERICDGRIRAYRRVDKVLKSSYESANGVQFIGYTDPNYRSGILDYFYYQPSYYILKADGSISEVRNVNDVAKLFPERKSEIKRYCAGHKKTSGRSGENKILAALEYLNK